MNRPICPCCGTPTEWLPPPPWDAPPLAALCVACENAAEEAGDAASCGLIPPTALRSYSRHVLRDAADDAASEVLWHLEHEGSAPAHMLERAESLLRAVGALSDEPPCPAAAQR